MEGVLSTQHTDCWTPHSATTSLLKPYKWKEPLRPAFPLPDSGISGGGTSCFCCLNSGAEPRKAIVPKTLRPSHIGRATAFSAPQLHSSSFPRLRSAGLVTVEQRKRSIFLRHVCHSVSLTSRWQCCTLYPLVLPPPPPFEFENTRNDFLWGGGGRPFLYACARLATLAKIASF